MNEQTQKLIEETLVKSRSRYPNNRLMLTAVLREVAELTETLQTKALPTRVRQEAADVIAVLVRIIEEGDASFDWMSTDPRFAQTEVRHDANTVNIFGAVHNSPISQGNK